MSYSDLKALEVSELKSRIVEAEKSLDNLEFAHKVSPVENPLRIRSERREIARLKSALHERTLDLVKAKVESGDLTRFNAREFLKTEKLPSPMTLAKIKKIIGRA